VRLGVSVAAHRFGEVGGERMSLEPLSRRSGAPKGQLDERASLLPGVQFLCAAGAECRVAERVCRAIGGGVMRRDLSVGVRVSTRERLCDAFVRAA